MIQYINRELYILISPANICQNLNIVEGFISFNNIRKNNHNLILPPFIQIPHKAISNRQKTLTNEPEFNFDEGISIDLAKTHSYRVPGDKLSVDDKYTG